jgi:hypothetical protein
VGSPLTIDCRLRLECDIVHPLRTQLLAYSTTLYLLVTTLFPDRPYTHLAVRPSRRLRRSRQLPSKTSVPVRESRLEKFAIFSSNFGPCCDSERKGKREREWSAESEIKIPSLVDHRPHKPTGSCYSRAPPRTTSCIVGQYS